MKITRMRRETTIGAQGIDDPNGITGVVCTETYKTDRQGLSVGVTVRVDYIEKDGRPGDLCTALAREIRRVEQGNQISLLDDVKPAEERAHVDPETGEVQSSAAKGPRRRNGWGKDVRV